MRLTPDIIEDLRLIDLSTDEAVVTRYEETTDSPVLCRYLLHEHTATIRDRAEALKAKEDFRIVLEAQKQHSKDLMRHYATTTRGQINKQALRAIKNRLGILFAKWEADTSTPVEDGFIYAYAVGQGLRPDQKKSLNDKDKAALDLTAKRVLQTIEAYMLYCLTFRGGYERPDYDLMNTKEEIVKAMCEEMRAEVKPQLDLLFAPEWEGNEEEQLTSSFEEEVQFFGEEAASYQVAFFDAMDGKKGRIQAYCSGLANEETEETAADKERALRSRYKDYINL